MFVKTKPFYNSSASIGVDLTKLLSKYDFQQYSFISHESFQRHNIMNKVILSPNGAYACVSSNDGSVITWDLNNIASVKILNKHTLVDT